VLDDGSADARHRMGGAHASDRLILVATPDFDKDVADDDVAVPARMSISRPVWASKSWVVTTPLPAVCCVKRSSASGVCGPVGSLALAVLGDGAGLVLGVGAGGDEAVVAVLGSAAVREVVMVAWLTSVLPGDHEPRLMAIRPISTREMGADNCTVFTQLDFQTPV
jgi:hypothetical protein